MSHTDSTQEIAAPTADVIYDDAMSISEHDLRKSGPDHCEATSVISESDTKREDSTSKTCEQEKEHNICKSSSAYKPETLDTTNSEISGIVCQEKANEKSCDSNSTASSLLLDMPNKNTDMNSRDSNNLLADNGDTNCNAEVSENYSDNNENLFNEINEHQSSRSESGSEDDDYKSADEGDDVNIDEEYLKEIEDGLSDEDKEDRRQRSRVFKEEGNDLFKESNFAEAVLSYTKALQLCPLAFSKDRSIMYANRAACRLRQEKHQASIDDCSKALELNPNYLKALLRRAELYEKVEKLDEALADYQKALEMDPSQHSARAACMRLPEQIKDRNEKMKTEMIGKLKDLGNMILRPFGLSTDNFQMNQDPNTGSYSVNFQQNAGKNNK